MLQLTFRSPRPRSAARAAAWGIVAAGLAAPLIRKRIKAPPLLTQTVAYAAPIGLCVAVRRSRARDVAVCALQMWAYLAAYKSPHDDERAQSERARIDYPIAVDRRLGLGELPTVRLQRALAKVGDDGPEWRNLDRALVWAHWMWFMVPHGAIAYILVRKPREFPRAAVMTYSVFNLGAIVYWVLPTAPPWYAASMAGRAHEFDGQLTRPAPEPKAPDMNGEGGHEIAVRRMMVEYGEFFWRDGWGPLYSVLGGNPLAAMPSLHFATSVMAASLLSESEPVLGTLAWAYALTLGFALVYLGEHYVVDLLAGVALTASVKRLEPSAGPALALAGRSVAALEAWAQAAR
jgi:membrane-associated phospholipid phosphatase